MDTPTLPRIRPPRSVRRLRLDHSFRILVVAMAVLLAGYLMFDRTFAWLHIPGTPIFVGEVVLVFGLYVVIQTPHLAKLTRISRPLQFLLLFMLWGFALAFNGLWKWGIVDTLRDSALWYYAGFALISSALVLKDPDLWDELVDRMTRYIPSFLLILVLRLAFSNFDVGIRIPDSNIWITSHKTANIAVNTAIALVFLLVVIGPSAGEQARQRLTSATLLGLLLIVAAGTQNRGGFVAAFIVLTVVFFIARHARAAMLGVLGVGILVAILAAALDVRFQLDRRELSVEQIIENVQSVTVEATSGSRTDNTTQWRLSFWTIVLDGMGEDRRFVAGYGFGENLAARFGFGSPDPSIPLRNPHNSHLSVLARMGFVGAGLWVAIFGSWYAGLIRARRSFLELGETQKAALSVWLMLAMAGILVNAFFDPTIEGPQVGILMWSLFGLGVVLGLGPRAVRVRRRGTGDFDWLLLETAGPAEAGDVGDASGE